MLAVSPNAAHYALAELEKEFDVHIITQNIDDLHERAGASNVLHLHGEIFKMRSEKSEHVIYEIKTDINIGDTAEDGGQLRPHIVWFEEPVPMITPAITLMQTAEIFVVIGTSLLVYPAAGLVDYAPQGIPKFIVDKKIPHSSAIHANLRIIEKPATEGVKHLQMLLDELR